MSSERLWFPTLNHDEGTAEQLAQRLCAYAIEYEVNRIENDDRASGWEMLSRPRAFEVTAHMRTSAAALFSLGTKGLEARVAYETARRQGFPCSRCGHQHKGISYQFQCFQCLCAERPPRRE